MADSKEIRLNLWLLFIFFYFIRKL